MAINMLAVRMLHKFCNKIFAFACPVDSDLGFVFRSYFKEVMRQPVKIIIDEELESEPDAHLPEIDVIVFDASCVASVRKYVRKVKIRKIFVVLDREETVKLNDVVVVYTDQLNFTREEIQSFVGLATDALKHYYRQWILMSCFQQAAIPCLDTVLMILEPGLQLISTLDCFPLSYGFCRSMSAADQVQYIRTVMNLPSSSSLKWKPLFGYALLRRDIMDSLWRDLDEKHPYDSDRMSIVLGGDVSPIPIQTWALYCYYAIAHFEKDYVAKAIRYETGTVKEKKHQGTNFLLRKTGSGDSTEEEEKKIPS